jgi:tetratricopeptide (TPR) repeat protein
MKRMITVAGAALFAASLARAQPKTAEEWDKDGETQYSLGNFDGAAESFKKAFEVGNKPNYLYNVAQAYRQGNKCKEAQFFYKRFLDLKDNDKSKPLTPERRAEVEGFITDLEECIKRQQISSSRPPTGTSPPEHGSGSDSGSGSGSGKRVGSAGSGSGSDDDDDNSRVTKTTAGPPKLISVRLEGGASKISAGSLDVPIQATGALIGGYPLAVMPELTLDLGAAFTFTPVPFENTMTNASKSASFIALLANVGASYEVIPKLSLRGDVGAGILLFSGLDEAGNPFTMSGQPTSGALGMFHIRVGASADYAITPNIIATITPIAFSYSPPKEGLKDDIKSITRLDFMLGLGYRM